MVDFPDTVGKIQARMKCPTLSGESGAKKRQTPSAKLKIIQRAIQARWKEEKSNE